MRYDVEKMVICACDSVLLNGYIKKYEANEEVWSTLESSKARYEDNALYNDIKAIEMAKSALEWIKSVEIDEFSNEYMEKLHNICVKKESSEKDLGVLVSLVPTYMRKLERDEEEKKIEERAKISNFVGDIKGKVRVEILSAKYERTVYSSFGSSNLYKFIDVNGNELAWFTTKFFDDEELKKAKFVSGTVKAHNEFRGIKQTTLTRCTIEFLD